MAQMPAVQLQREGIQQSTGVYVTKITPDSAAEKVGIRVGDVLLKLDDVDVNQPTDIVDYMRKKKFGSRLIVTIMRYNEEKKLIIDAL
jgi:serine protease DegS